MDIQTIKSKFETKKHQFFSPTVTGIEEGLIEVFKHRVGEKYDGTYIEPAAAKIAKHLTGEFYRGLLLFGNTGSGKTMMMQIVVEFLNHFGGKRFELISANELFNIITTKKDTGISYYDRTYAFIDDLGTEPQKHYNTHPVIDFLEEKYMRNHIVFATTNLGQSSGEILKHYGQRVDSRFHEMFEVISFGNTDFRLK